MRWLVDLLYALAGLVSAPVWLFRMTRTGKIRTDWRARFGRTRPVPRTNRPRILLHAVSVGEVNAIRMLVDRLAASADQPEIVIATTTDTGFARAMELWGDRHHVVRYPFDFSTSVHRFLRSTNPDVAVLVELEVWPNFTAACKRRGIPVMVVNGRLTARSFDRYRRVVALVRPSFSRLSCVAAQNESFAQRFTALGVPSPAVDITGTMKWDTAQIADEVPGAAELAIEMGIDRSKLLIVAGSTAPDEHALLRDATPPDVQLLCAPRKPEWFAAAAAELPGCIKRSGSKMQNANEAGSTNTPHTGRFFLLDTIGELRKAYALADIVVIGRSFGDLHGSDMMEPVALGKPTIVGPAVADFQDAVDALLAGDGLVQTTASELGATIRHVMSDESLRTALACNGRRVIQQQQGATQRNADLILRVLADHRQRRLH